MTLALKPAYSRFINADPNRLHFAAHSHHYWPDCTRDAHIQYWDDSAKYTDRKWDHVFSHVIPKAQMHIARTLNLSEPSQIAFAPNTHEFVARILSCFEPGKPLRVLTTDSEFHSFRRQIQRHEELGNVHVEHISTEPFSTFTARFVKEAASKPYDLVFVSHVFFNSGFVFNGIEELSRALDISDAIIVIDGYHGFSAIPTNLKPVEDRVFYTAGGYKYAQAGEGACFLAVPRNCDLRPLNTGWFASFSTLESGATAVDYDTGGMRFWGSTFDPSGVYRLNAAFDWFETEGLTVDKIHQHVCELQAYFLSELGKANVSNISRNNLINADNLNNQGHFLTFRTNSAKQIHDALRRKNVIVDYRSDRLRFGFGLYQDLKDINELIARLK